MESEFQDDTFKEINYRALSGDGNLVKAEDAKIVGVAKITMEQDAHDGIKIVLKKDSDDNIKEIKFICSCGETKSVLLDYNE